MVPKKSSWLKNIGHTVAEFSQSTYTHFLCRKFLLTHVFQKRRKRLVESLPKKKTWVEKNIHKVRFGEIFFDPRDPKTQPEIFTGEDGGVPRRWMDLPSLKLTIPHLDIG